MRIRASSAASEWCMIRHTVYAGLPDTRKVNSKLSRAVSVRLEHSWQSVESERKCYVLVSSLNSLDCNGNPENTLKKKIAHR